MVLPPRPVQEHAQVLVHGVGRVGRVPEGEEVVGLRYAFGHELPCPKRSGIEVFLGGRGGGGVRRPVADVRFALPYALGLTVDKVGGTRKDIQVARQTMEAPPSRRTLG